MESGQQIGRETFGLIILVAGIVTAVAMVLTVYYFVEDSDVLISLVFAIPPALGAVSGVLIMKGVLLKQLKSNAEVAAERSKRY